MKLDFTPYTIIVMGDVMLDVYFMGQVQRLSPEAPVPIVRVRAKTDTIGGAGNVALNLAGLGCPTILVGIRGDDAAGSRLSAICRERGIDDNIAVNAAYQTVTKTRIIGQGQQLLRLDEEQDWRNFQALKRSLLNRFEKGLALSKAVILSDYDKGALRGDILPEMIALCRKKRVPVFVDPKGTDWKRYDGATCITPNTPELELVSGKSIGDDDTRLVKTARMIQKRYHLEWLLVTRGAMGMCLVGADSAPVFIPAAAREVYDVSGAGDTVIASLAAGVASGLPFPKAASLANVAAGIVVGKLGSQAISLPELEAALYKADSGSGTGSPSKITTLDAARVQVRAWQAIGQKVVFTNGCFDLLHPGHIHILHQAKAAGDRLVVGVNTDASIRKIKGPDRPIVSEQDRADVLSALGCVDLILFFKEETPLSLIKTLKPDVLVKGADYTLQEVVGHEVVAAYGGEVRLVPLLPGHSTTGIVKRLNQKKQPT